MAVASVRFVVAAALALTCISCGKKSPPTTPTPPVVEPPTISCSPSVSVDGTTTPRLVPYTAPLVTGGTAPVVTQCSHEASVPFDEGTTDVTCTATDNIARKAQCSFSVSVKVTRSLLGTRFLAFGDSVTAGEVTGFTANVRALDPVNNYPKVLQGLLNDRYKPQSVVVQNAGNQGEYAAVPETAERFDGIVRDTRPDALLLMEGYNDVKLAFSAEAVADALALNVLRAKQYGVKQVFLATLAPQTQGTHAFYPPGVPELNALIRDIAAQPNVVLVDVFAAVDPQKATLIGKDGLHPTVEGYAVIAQTFFDAIKKTFEVVPAPQSLFARPAEAR